MNQDKTSLNFSICDEGSMLGLGAHLAKALKSFDHGGALVFLHGDLGAGKTVLTRGLIQSLGHQGSVKSPTYTLVEPYESLSPCVYHFDLYRLGSPIECEEMGIRDYLEKDALCLIEWPDKAKGVLENPDIVIRIELGEGQTRHIQISVSKDLVKLINYLEEHYAS